MKTELVDVNETRKNLVVEIPTDVVDAEIARVTTRYSKQARLPGFRPGKVPAKVVRQRFKGQILHDVAEHLVGRAVDEALVERGVEPVEQPTSRTSSSRRASRSRSRRRSTWCRRSIRATSPTIELRKPPASMDDEAVNQALERLRERAARFEPVEGRRVEAGHTVVVDLERQGTDKDGKKAPEDKHEQVSIELGAPATRPGFDEQLIGHDGGRDQELHADLPGRLPDRRAGRHARSTTR